MPPVYWRRHRRPIVMLILTAAVLALPLASLASHNFADVPTSASYHDDVEALLEAGITAGCGGGNYCPTSPVTRGQMAQFLNRLGNLDGTTPPSVDADKIDGIDSSGLLQTGSIVTAVDGGAWEPITLIAPTVADRFATNNQFSGDGAVVLPLTAPSLVGTATYGLASVQVCMTFAASGAFIDRLEIFRMDGTGSSFLVFADETNRGSKGCFTVLPNLAVGEGLALAAALGGGADAILGLGSVETTWSSEGDFSVTEIGPADPNVVGSYGH